MFFWFSDAGEKEGVQFSEPQKAQVHDDVSRQVSQQSSGEGSQLSFPIYVYNCSFEQLKEQLVHPNSSQRPRDIFFRCVPSQTKEKATSHIFCCQISGSLWKTQ